MTTRQYRAGKRARAGGGPWRRIVERRPQGGGAMLLTLECGHTKVWPVAVAGKSAKQNQVKAQCRQCRPEAP